MTYTDTQTLIIRTLIITTLGLACALAVASFFTSHSGTEHKWAFIFLLIAPYLILRTGLERPNTVVRYAMYLGVWFALASFLAWLNP